MAFPLSSMSRLSRANLRSVTACLASSSSGLTVSNSNCQRRSLSQRSWNVVRYHPELKQAIQFVADSTLPTIYRPNDILVRVLASSVNPLDIEMTRGYGSVLLTLANIVMSTGVDRLHYDRLPLTLGRDFVGQIVTRGNEVSLFKPGDLVWGTVPPYENGAHADYVITSESGVSRLVQCTLSTILTESFAFPCRCPSNPRI